MYFVCNFIFFSFILLRFNYIFVSILFSRFFFLQTRLQYIVNYRMKSCNLKSTIIAHAIQKCGVISSKPRNDILDSVSLVENNKLLIAICYFRFFKFNYRFEINRGVRLCLITLLLNIATEMHFLRPLI